MTDVQCFTSASLAYLDRVRVLGETIRRYHPEWTFTLCLCDSEPDGFSLNLAEEPFDVIVRIEELDIPNLQSWIFQHDVVELCTAVKGVMLCRLLDQAAEDESPGRVIYLDPDIALFGSLSTVIESLDRYAMVLTPHQLDPEVTTQAVIDNEIGSLKHGTYNLGFLAVSGCKEGRRFAAWWRDRLLEFCFDDIPGGLFTDQRWCDLVPGLFQNVGILRDPGYNVASWNLGKRPISIDNDGMIWAADRPLRFFHFTKVADVGEVMLERYSPNSVTVFELLKWYRRRLAAQAAHTLPSDWWAFSLYRDGRPIPKQDRVVYRTHADLRRRVPNPFGDRVAVQLG